MTEDVFVYGRDSALARKHFNAEQRGRCAICSTVTADLVVDHEHSEKSLCRGLLCMSCNTALGFLADDPARMQAAIAYLARHQERNAAYEGTEDWQERSVKVTHIERPMRLNPYHRRVRDAKIREAAVAGDSAKDIAARFKVSPSRVYSLCRVAA